jgi:hypothetical protein
MVISLISSKSNKDLTLKEFHIANNIKRAMVNLHRGEYEETKNYLMAALRTLSRIDTPAHEMSMVEEQWS